MPKAKPQAVFQGWTRDDVGRILGTLADLGARVNEVNGVMNQELVEVKQRYQKSLDPLLDHYATLEKDLKKWAKLRKETEFSDDKRSIDFVHGTISFSLTPPKVEFLDEEDVIIARLEKRGLDQYVRTESHVSKERLLQDRSTMSTASLESLGLAITQKDNITITPKLESVEEARVAS